MKPNDIVQPTSLCLKVIHKLRAHHRGIVVAYPDRWKAVIVKWDHRPRPVVMAGRYVEIANEDKV